MTRWLGLPETLTKDPEMLNTWIPIIKADYRLLENYHFQPGVKNLPLDFTILKGKFDHWLTNEEYKEWRIYSDRDIEFYEINGGHLFIHDQKQEIIDIINKTVEGYF